VLRHFNCLLERKCAALLPGACEARLRQLLSDAGQHALPFASVGRVDQRAAGVNCAVGCVCGGKQAGGQMQHRRFLAAFGRPTQRGTEVAVFVLEALEPGSLFRPCKPLFGGLGQL
jgi:hypothetical protein